MEVVTGGVRRVRRWRTARRALWVGAACLAAAAGLPRSFVSAQQAPGTAQPTAESVAIDADDIGGIVRSANGPEAGVWVIAETTDLPTKFRKMVVTDDAGRYLLPDLPTANYRIWVRGYGLVDSQPVTSTRGRRLGLTALVAPDATAAAAVYPAGYWFSLLQIPPKSAFPLGVTHSQEEYIWNIKVCITCHQLGNKATREIPASLGTFSSSVDAWERRVRSGQVGRGMTRMVGDVGTLHQGLTMFADWTDRIAKGELQPVPPRPRGVERNLVLSSWDAGGPYAFLHDVVSTDKRTPTINSNGKVFAVEYHNDSLIALDPLENTVDTLPIPTLEPKQFMRASTSRTIDLPSPYWGEEIIFNDFANPNALMMDSKGRVWMSAAVRRVDNLDFCKAGSNNKFAQAYPLNESTRHVSMYDPATNRFTSIPTCFRTHHLQFANDKDQTLYLNPARGNVLGWINTHLFDETGDIEASQGWCGAYRDVNGDGRIDPKVDAALDVDPYSVIPDPKDGVVWAASPGVPGKIIRMDRGTNAPQTCVFEVYEPPFGNAQVPGVHAYTPRGIDIDSNGVIWTALAGSSHMASFDRRKCKTLSGPAATGQHCPEGWTLYPMPGPNFKGVSEHNTTETAYYNWVDRGNVLGMGRDTPLANGTNFDSLMVLQPRTSTWTTLRVPYPLGFYQRGMDGRIDDGGAGWKGRGLWASNGSRSVWHTEGGKGVQSQIVHFQMRPNPLAK
jgi:hypothetical protein